jgi:formylglycine-generating enzyme required for sulfatase activity
MSVNVPDLVRVPAGSFLMGSDTGDENERPEHIVTLGAFDIGASPVTQAEYAAFVQATGWRPPGVWELPTVVRPEHGDEFKRQSSPYWWMANQPPPGREDHPVVLVTFEDAREYCRWLASVAGRPFRLPTEAEWEKAARGGLERQAYPWGNDIDLSLASFLPRAGQRAGYGTRPVKAYPPNAFGLYDMAGNVWNWTADWYRPDYYHVSEGRSPSGPGTGTLRVLRGGAWTNDDVNYLRCAVRHPVPPDTYSYSIGIRVVCSAYE